MPQRNVGQISTNETIKNWLPRMESVDSLWVATLEEKQEIYANNTDACVQVAYQTPVYVTFSDGSRYEFIPTTFEDALAYENFETFKTLTGIGGIKKLRTVFKTENVEEIARKVYELIYGAVDEKGKKKKGSLDKAEFALQLLYNKDPKNISPPQYIAEALSWLQSALLEKETGDFLSSEEG